MKSVPATIFVAFDGTRFFDEKEGDAYEAQHWHRLLEGMSAIQIQQSLDRTDVERADAIERAARIIAKKRVASGERRRAKNGAAESSPDEPTADHADDHAAEEAGE